MIRFRWDLERLGFRTGYRNIYIYISFNGVSTRMTKRPLGYSSRIMCTSPKIHERKGIQRIVNLSKLRMLNGLLETCITMRKQERHGNKRQIMAEKWKKMNKRERIAAKVYKNKYLEGSSEPTSYQYRKCNIEFYFCTPFV